MQRWEYCAIVGIKREERWLKGHYPALWQFGADGVKESRLEGKSEESEIGKQIFQLGLDGWELVSAPSTSNVTHMLYFKRPLPDQ